MEVLGDRLKKVREDKGYSIEQVSRETNIARQYLRALEDEDFSVFPGDTYLVGFLHNYADYLGLDSDEMVSLYKNMKLQEQPAPIEELLEPPRRRSLPTVLILVVLVLVAAGGGLYKFVYLPHGTPGGTERSVVKKKDTSKTAPVSSPYVVSDSVIEKYFKQGDTLLIPAGGGKVLVHLKSVTDTVVLAYPSGSESFKLGVTKTVDLDHDGKGDINVTVNDIDRKAQGAVLRFDRFVSAPPKAATVPVTQPAAPSPAGTVSILSADSPAPFVLTMVFRGYCLVRYVADSGKRIEQSFNKGETLRLDIDSKVRLWISNAGALRGQIGGKDVVFGKSGAVSAALVTWKKNDRTGTYDLQLVPVN